MTSVLKPRQKVFVKEYVKNGGNATRAYESAYPVGVTYGSLRSEGARLLAKPSIKAEIDRICEKLGYGPEEALTDVINEIKNNPEEKRHYMQMYFDVTGNKAPIKTENKTELSTQEITSKELHTARKALLTVKQN